MNRNTTTLSWRPEFIYGIIQRAILIAAVGLLLTATPAVAQERAGVLERIGAFFGGTVEVEIEDGAVLVENLEVLVAAGEATPGEIVIRKKRLDAWCLAMEESLTEYLSLTGEQHAGFKELLAKELALSQRRWKKQDGNKAIADTTVILFTGRTGPTARIQSRAYGKGLSESLTEEQQERLSKLRTERNRRIGDWFARRATAVIDSELFLNDEQRTACFEDVRLRIARRSNGLYAFHKQHYYLPYEPARQFASKFKALQLTRAQQQRYQDLLGSDQNQNNHVMITVSTGNNEENQKQVEAACQTAKTRFLKVAAVRAEYIATSLKLPQDQTRYLEIAGKGATVRCLKAWKKQTEKQVEQFAKNPQFAGGQQIGLGGPDVRTFSNDQLWKTAVKKVSSKTDLNVQEDREKHILDGAVSFVMATLDRELFLDDDQVEDLRSLVEETEPHRVNTHQYYMLELAIMARMLVRIDDKQLAEVLNESQMECWKQIKTPFRFQGKERANITTQHGDMNLNLMAPKQRRRNSDVFNLF
jgi:hypothetical protein